MKKLLFLSAIGNGAGEGWSNGYKSKYLYSRIFRPAILSILVAFVVSCDSGSEKEDDPVPEPEYMQWTANVELNTKEIMGEHNHTIFFPATDCSYEIKCTNFPELHFFMVGVVGEHPWPDEPGYVPVEYWCSYRAKVESIYDGKSVVTPYYSFEIKGNTLYANLKGGTVDPVPCKLVFGIKADDDHCDTFEFVPE